MDRKALSTEEVVGAGYPTVITPVLLVFLEEWLAWAKAPDCSNSLVFSKRLGLCGSLLRWCGVNPCVRKYAYLSDSLETAFIKGGYDKSYPFGEPNFSARIRDYTQHLDPLRLEWVENTIAATKREMNRPTQRITL